MLYLSTRGHPDRKHFCEILLEGLAPDGGLYLPERYPQVEAATLARWRTVFNGGAAGGYAALAFEVLSLYIDDIPADDLRARALRLLARREYSRQELASRLLSKPAPKPAQRNPRDTFAAESLVDEIYELPSASEVNALLDDLEQRKMLSDDRYAEMRARLRAPRLRARQKDALSAVGAAPRFADRFDAIPRGRPLLLVANEFLDALAATTDLLDATIRNASAEVGNLLADYPGAADFLHAPVTVGDDPVAREQFGWQRAVVLDGNGVGEGETVLLGLRLFCQKAGDDADVDLITRIGHARRP